MGKVIGFELKKLVSRIGIYILAILLAGVLVAGIFMYDPIERSVTTHSLVGETISDMHTSFNNLKQDYLLSIENIADDASTYVTSSPTYTKYNKEEINNLLTKFDEYCILYNEPNLADDEYSVLLVGINESLTKLKTSLDEALEYTKNKTGYYVLTTNNNYTKLYSAINKIIINYTSPLSHTFASERYFNELRTPLYKSIKELIYPNLNDTAKKYTKTGTYYTLITSRMEEIVIKIDALKQKVSQDSTLEQDIKTKNELNELFNRYVNCVEIFTNSYQVSMCASALNDVNSKSARVNLVGYNKVSLYEQEELSVQYDYYIQKHCTANDFANSLSFTHTSNGKANAYDFTFFVMSIFTIAVMIFVIYASAHTISGEISNNTMRFTAIRPIKRSSLYFGKYLAIIIMSFILLIFGTITSLSVGGILFGFDSANILMIFNGNSVLVAHPLALIGLFILSILLIFAVYSALTMMLSAVLKSDLLSMVVGVVIYAVNLILPIFFGAGSWLRFNPLTNLNLFAYFGSTRLTSNTVIGKLFNTIVYQGMNIWISLVYVVGFVTLLLLIGKLVFKKREL